MLRDCSRPEDCKSSVYAIQIKASPRKLINVNFRGLPVSVFLFLISDCNLRAEEEGCLVVMLLHRHRTRVVTCEVCIVILIVILVDVEDGEVDINLSAHQAHPVVASECGSSPFFASSIVSINFIFLMIVSVVLLIGLSLSSSFLRVVTKLERLIYTAKYF
jgi:hypothetical protein